MSTITVDTKVVQDLVEMVAIAEAAMQKMAAERDQLQKSASARPDYSKDMEPRAEAILGLLAKTTLRDYRFDDANGPLRKQAAAELHDPLKAVDVLTYAMGRMVSSSPREAEAPKPMGGPVDGPASDPNHPDHAYFAGLN